MAYTPLTPEQYQKARQAGFSPDQIIANEKIRKQQSGTPPTTAQVSAAAPGGINITDINAPAYDMSQNNSGLLGTVGKESANIVKSGVKFGKGIVDFFNPVEAVKKVAQIPEAIGGYFGDLSAAAKSEAEAQRLEAKASAIGKKPVAAPTDFTTLQPSFGKAAYETLTPPAIQEAFKGNVTDALTSAANDPFQFAPLLLAAKELPGGEAKIDAGISKVKDVTGKAADVVKTKAAEVYAKVPESMKPTGTGITAVDNYFKGTPLEDQVANLDATIKKGIDKGVKPTVVGKRTLGKRDAFYEKSTNAIKTIADLKDQLKITDPITGEAIDGAPKSVAQGAQATDQGLKLIWKQSENLMKEAGKEGASFDASPTIKTLTEMSKNIGHSPEIRKYAKSLIPEIKELNGQNPEVVAQRIAELNKSLEGYYKGNVSNARATVDAAAAAEMRKAMDASIEKVLEGAGNQTLRNQYGELKALDKEMQHRATVVGRQAPKSLFGGITDVGAISELVRGLVRMSPADLASSFAIKGLGEYIKKLNSPDANVAKMFDAAYKVKDAASAAGFKSLRDLTPDVIKLANKATDLTKANGGVTISLKGEVPTEGFSVATSKATEHTVPQETFSKADTLSYIAKNFDALKQEGNYIGAWLDNGKIYLDVPTVFKDVKKAAQAAKAADQLGIFDLSKFETIGKENYEKIIGNDKTRTPGNTRAVQRKTVEDSGGTGTSGRAGEAKGPNGKTIKKASTPKTKRK